MRFKYQVAVTGVIISIVSLAPSVALAATRAGLIPTFSIPVSTADGFTVNVTNYSPSYTFTSTVAAGKVTTGTTLRKTRQLTVTGLAVGQSAKVSVKVTRKGYPTKAGTVVGVALMGAALLPTFSTPVSAADGFMVSVTDYDPSYTFKPTVSVGTVTGGTASNSVLPLTVTGIAAGQSATITVVVERTEYATGTGTAVGSAMLAGPWKQISVAQFSMCAVTKTGAAYCWGDNTYGQLGNNSRTNSLVPVAVSGLSSGVASISSETGEGDNGINTGHTCAISTAGAAYCWGDNFAGQLGNNSTASSLIPVAVSGLSRSAASISVGGGSSCAVTTAGAAYCWGAGGNWQLGDNSQFGSLVPVAVIGLSSGVSSIDARGDHTCAVTTAGAAYCWGVVGGGIGLHNSQLQSQIPTLVSGFSSGVASISVGLNQTCVVTTSGAAYCSGGNNHGELGNNSTTDSLVPVAVTGLSSGVASIIADIWDTCAVTTAGAAYCWGAIPGQTGFIGPNSSFVPLVLTGFASGVASLGMSTNICLLTTTGATYCQGFNSAGQLGNNSTVDSWVPALVANP
jgi:hypothetical protein